MDACKLHANHESKNSFNCPINHHSQITCSFNVSLENSYFTELILKEDDQYQEDEVIRNKSNGGIDASVFFFVLLWSCGKIDQYPLHSIHFGSDLEYYHHAIVIFVKLIVFIQYSKCIL